MISIALASTATRPDIEATTPLTVVAYASFVGWCFALCTVDLRERRLPNALTGAGAVGVLGFAAATGRGSVALVGALLLAAVYLTIHLIAPAAFGAGDVKLAVGLGGAAACGGAQTWVWAALGAPLLTALIGGAHLLLDRFRRRSRMGSADSAVPHGPAMCLATIAALVLVH
ncbi:prepilin peptidase [Nocardia alni]|uniref:prepilin peptidase n=1 Tax=Nocardia alni TaxID=2815723 RepID=UPI0027E100A3|nr:prepilin peptidase [Nocardia alni]